MVGGSALLGAGGRVIGGESGEEKGAVAGEVLGPFLPGITRAGVKGLSKASELVGPGMETYMKGQSLIGYPADVLGTGRAVTAARMARESPEVLAGTRLEEQIANQLRASGTPLRPPNPLAMPIEEIPRAIDAELERLKTVSPDTWLNRRKAQVSAVGEKVAGFVGSRVAEEKNMLTKQVAQNQANRQMGSQFAHFWSDWWRSAKKVFPIDRKTNQLLTIPEEDGLSRNLDDVMSNPTRYSEWLTEEQMAVAQKNKAFWESTANTYENTTGEEFVRVQNAEAYFPRRVMTDPDGRPITEAADAFEKRTFATRAEGEAAGWGYDMDMERVGNDAVRRTYNRMADQIMSKEYSVHVGQTPQSLVAREIRLQPVIDRESLMATRKSARSEIATRYREAKAAVGKIQTEIARTLRGENLELRAAKQADEQLARATAKAKAAMGADADLIELGKQQAKLHDALVSAKAGQFPGRGKLDAMVGAASRGLEQAKLKLARITGKQAPVGGTTMEQQRELGTFWETHVQGLGEFRAAGKAASVQDIEARIASLVDQIQATKSRLSAEFRTAAGEQLAGRAATRRTKTDILASLREEAADAKATLRMTEKPSDASLARHPDVMAAEAKFRESRKVAKWALADAKKPEPGYRLVTGRVGGNRIYSKEVAEAIEGRFGEKETENLFRLAQDVLLSPLRVMKTTFDLGVGLIQGFNMLVTRPEAWTRGVIHGFGQVAHDTGQRAKWIEGNSEAIAQLLETGHWKPRSLMQDVGATKLVPRQLEELFSNPLNVMGVEMWKSATDQYGIGLKDTRKLRDLADVVTVMTGTVGKGGGANESRILFAANFIRSQLALMANVAKSPGGIRGTDARRLFRNTFVLATLGTIGINEAQGREWTLDIRDPLGFTIRVGNQNINLLGPWAPIFRGLAYAVTGDPMYLMTHTTRGKLGPGYSTLVDLATEHDYMGNFVSLLHPETLPEYAAKQVSPLGLSDVGKSFQDMDLTNPKGALTAVGTGAAALLGARMFPLTDWQKRDDEFGKDYPGKTYDEGTKTEKDAFDKAHPEFNEAMEKRTAEQYATLDHDTIVYHLMNAARDSFDAGMAKIPTLPTGLEQRNYYNSLQEAYGNQLFLLESANPEEFRKWQEEKAKTPREQVYKDYTAIFGKYGDESGQMTEEEKSKMFEDIDGFMANLNDTQAKELQEDIGAGDSEWLTKFRADQQIIKPYWNASDIGWPSWAKGHGIDVVKYPTFDSYVAAKTEYAIKNKVDVANLASEPVIKTFTADMSERRRDIRYRQPEIDVLLHYWGYNPTVLRDTPAAKMYYERYGVPPRETKE
jgi:hypothetical protein